MVPTKRHSSAKAKSSSLSGKTKVSRVHEYGQGLVGSRIRVWWPMDFKFYEGVVESYSSSRKTHRVKYDDGDVENLHMRKERWQLIVEDEDTVAEEISVEEAATDESSAEGTPEPMKTRAGKGKAVATVPKKTDSSAKSNLGNVGGKVLAAASRMSLRGQRKENGQPKASSARKNTAALGNLKRKRGSSPSEAKLKKPRAYLRKLRSSNPDEEETSDEEDSKPLVSFMNKMKEGMEKDGGENSSRNGKESSESEAGVENSEKGEDTSDNESGEGEGREGEEESEGEQGTDGGEGSQESEGEEGSGGGEEKGESSGNETDES